MDVVDLMSVHGILMPTVAAANNRQHQQSEVEIQHESGAQKNFQNMMGNVESRPPQKIFQSPSKEELVLALKRIVQEKEMKLQNAKVQIAALSSQVANQKQLVAVYENLNKKDVELHEQYKELHKQAIELHKQAVELLKVNASFLELKDQKIRDLENQLATPPSAHNQKTKGSDNEKWMLGSLLTLGEKLKEHGLLTIQYQKKLTDWKAGMMGDGKLNKQNKTSCNSHFLAEEKLANDKQAAVEEATQDSSEIAPEKESDEESELQVVLPSVPDVKGDVPASPELGASEEQGSASSLPEEAVRVLPEATENVDMQEVEAAPEAGAGANVEEKKDGEKAEEATELAKQCSTGQEGVLPNLYPENADSKDSDLDDRMEALLDDVEVSDDSRVGNDSLILHSRSGSDGSSESGMQMMDGLQPDDVKEGAGHDPETKHQHEPKFPIHAEPMETAKQTANLAVEEAVGPVKALSPAAESEAAATNEESVGEPEQSSTVKDQEAVTATGPVNGLAQKKRRKRRTSIFSRKRKSPASRKPRTQKVPMESLPEEPVSSEDKEPVAEESQVQEAELSEPDEAEVQEPKASEEEKEASLPMKISRKRKGAPEPKETLPGVRGTLVGTWNYSPGKEDRPLTLIKANLPTKSCHLKIYSTPCNDEDSAGDVDPQVQLKIVRWADKDAEPAPQDDFPDDIPAKKMVASSISKPAKERKEAKMSRMAKLKGQLSKTYTFLQPKLQ